MTQVYSKALDRSIEIERIIGEVRGTSGPTVVITSGIHGNEPAGVFALKEIFDELEFYNHQLNGNFIGLGGHLSALSKGLRFFENDLNRIWTNEKLEQARSIKPGNSVLNDDLKELMELDRLLSELIETGKGPFYFFDIHTTSGDSVPFITLNDTLVNRRFAQHYSTPIILGIEEHINGTFLNYVNSLGYVSMGFEAGQHDTIDSIENAKAFIHYTLSLTGVLDESFDRKPFERRLKLASRSIKDFFEIRYRKPVAEGDGFEMNTGYENFQPVEIQQKLAKDHDGAISSQIKGRILMPLYQKKGEDGFFLIKRTRRIALWVSKWLRKINFDAILTLMPGVSWLSSSRDALVVDIKIARYMAVELFHLLGYRNRHSGIGHIIVRKREASSRYREYKKESWY